MGSIKWYPAGRRELDGDVRAALEQTAHEMVRDLRESQTMPRRTGQLSEQTTADVSASAKGRVSVVSSTPYARRLYFHPEYRFSREVNENAGAKWFEPYKKGGLRHRWLVGQFAKLLEARRAR